MTFAPWEKILLAVLLLAAVALFVRDFSRRLKQIRAGAADRVRTDRPGSRLWRTFKEVFLHTRVIAARPVVGVMHLAVFLGFVLFGAETIDHFLKGFGVPFLKVILGERVATFKTVIAVMAVLVTAGISGLAFRRFVLVKISPDPRSWSSGLVALFIVILMLTYLNSFQAKPVLAKANWWAHTLTILIFPSLILRSKHLHLLLSPCDIFFRTHRLGDYLPLNLDLDRLAETDEVKLGLETVADVPWKMRLDFLTCVECKRCTEQCPAWNSGQELNPRGFILAGRRALALPPETPVIGSIITATELGQCTSCGACENVCPVGIEHLQLLLGAKRAQALALGTGMVATEFLEKVEQYGNPLAARKEVRASLLRELELPLYERGKTEYLLWLGCVWSYNTDMRSSVAAMAKVLKQAQVSFGVLAEENCSGHHSRRQGEEMQFQTLARANLAAFEHNGVRKIISPCPHCLHTFRREYPTLAPNFNVTAVHHSEFITDLLAAGRLQLQPSAANGKRLTYHDPCYLGRYEKVYAAPRQVIRKAGFQITELPRHGERSLCCGGGSAGFAREQKVAKRVDQTRKEEIAASGAKILITACPECKMMLNAAVEQTKDLAELVAENL
ncbi:MAG: (Fe-S)-binding protein [candidate division KSB1 bacterium]|nr:(Fe-S)-binding protein [candidate division KSB1 bacterium]MDZ7273452.1 (Fe-S)-binding protein [candidate division KSB1 bacterium]MDZ7286956.1 (Fe-S)-binding protein [candidate division KSB1 bacterium]MDZ7299691.1 (Fe-S)-binding protein [candidate division KSB1 bacterium]MDZ7308711.1 (Fe-S)-binding protein [candidate division KSB1 bacterium]